MAKATAKRAAAKAPAKKSGAKKRSRRDELAPVGAVHNSKAERERQALFVSGLGTIERLETQKASIVSKIRNSRKTMKAEGFAIAEINYGLFLRKADKEEVLDKRKLEHRVAKYLGHAVVQLDLFAESTGRTEESAYEEGRVAGLAGETATPPAGNDPENPRGRKRGGKQSATAAHEDDAGDAPPAGTSAAGEDEFEAATPVH
jgi:uncharacterized protein (UPF0335 family)